MLLLYRVNNVNEAIQVAQKLKKFGHHDLFRGQRENWPLISSFLRLSADDRERELKSIGSYINWVQNSPGLEYLRNDRDGMIAVAQHYGLKTNYIDFTTDPTVAAFFATEKAKQTNGLRCILCLKTDDLLNFWKSYSSVSNTPSALEIIRVNVPNLWRLEAQKGVFLYCPYENLENIYDLDRILFPASEPVSSPTPEEMYPRKSKLEQLLDQWFMTKKRKRTKK